MTKNVTMSERVDLTIQSRGGTRVVSIQKKYENCTNLSQVIRAMSKDGMKSGPISKDLGIRYQHVRNTLLNPPLESNN